MAKALGEEKAVELLDKNLAEEKAALQLVEKIATRISKEHAAGVTGKSGSTGRGSTGPAGCARDANRARTRSMLRRDE